MTDSDAHEFYRDPEHLAVAGPGQRRERPMKTAMVPVRFTPELIAAVKHLALLDAVTVSTWIRNLVAREVQRRQPPATSPAASVPNITVDYTLGKPLSETAPSSVTELVCSH
ncbi:MAG TPA: hypothetical protein VKU39_16480 [Streptosporangiaceae bacterium]|nr:hypothetical protein [Streptosporangiaceae bacterium]